MKNNYPPYTSANYPVSVSSNSPTRSRQTIPNQHGAGWFGPGPSQPELDEQVARKAEMLYREKIASDTAEKIAKMRASGPEKQRARYAQENKKMVEKIRKDFRSKTGWLEWLGPSHPELDAEATRQASERYLEKKATDKAYDDKLRDAHNARVKQFEERQLLPPDERRAIDAREYKEMTERLRRDAAKNHSDYG
jgi:hypothetical protein